MSATVRANVVYLVAAMAWVVPATSGAIPPIVNGDGVDGESRVFLSLRRQVIVGDLRSHCSVRVVATGNDLEFSDGDRIEIQVLEDDLIGNDELWSNTFDLEEAEIGGNRVDRTFDCATEFSEDIYGTLEVFATAHVYKASCGWACNEDDPTSGSLVVERIEDDAAEEDDTSEDAVGLPLGVLPDRIGRDQDWFSVDIAERAMLSLRTEHPSELGRLDTVLFDETGNERVITSRDELDGNVIEINPLLPGSYRVRVTPRNGADYNFYDIRLAVLQAPGDCQPGTIDIQECGRCGSKQRRCSDEGNWGELGPCEGEGACQPGETRTSDCGECGTLEEFCLPVCEWEVGACVDDGECIPGATDEAACLEGPGVRTRECTESCTWGPHSECQREVCDPGETRSCYTGPPDTQGIGACSEGFQVCEGESLGQCEGDVTPVDEICADGIDNDCDGSMDADDGDCGAEPTVGDPCDQDDDCGEDWYCVGAPDHPMFVDGYCGAVGCAGNCGERAACVTIFAESYCLRRCEHDGQCRPGYGCSSVGVREVCVPRCTDDSDCRDPQRPVCELSTGQCVTEAEVSRDDARVLPADAGPHDAAPDVPGSGSRPDVHSVDTLPSDATLGDGALGEDELVAEGCRCDAVGRGGDPSAVWGLMALLALLLPCGRGNRRRDRGI